MATPTSSLSLLPKHNDEFHSKEYWDRFFLERGGENFEWYGKYEELAEHIRGKVTCMTSEILNIGCGNSDLSSDMFDDGYQNITNLDFSPLVIQEMIAKNSVTHPSMKWNVGDMTSMPGIAVTCTISLYLYS